MNAPAPHTLAGQGILITRPEQQGSALVKKLSQLGAHVVHYPVLELQPLTLDDPARAVTKQLLLNLDNYHHVIFISTNAVHYGAEWMQEFWPQWPLGIQWHAIGVATANAMLRYDLDASAPTVAMNSEALLQLMDLQHIEQQKVLIVRGVGGREYLAEQLQARGALVDYAECYQRHLPSRPKGELAAIIETQNINTLCVNSGESLANFIALAGAESLAQLTVLVPGQRVAGLAQQAGAKNIIVADNASDDACVAALQQFAKNSTAN
ncbi:uroporphyrinogen-III synthase [Dasania sp. GY-MA-18]|uniref:Uroporphyrinogen-III synthase n=1 Tax=Dasania phycosphaerae TaxID=2950436 RepID=A0A9J6RL30_9GAMM|nr:MULTISPECIES: uroporphyrinogen-III synthase [Dasania]MCR8922484.1 uroporphyrinogen-III synthase [Dasania sp. GY-MA-18]MCZ0864912.1 uroporphyrinogen-III synthase [Dasania phycosphaerae]MCZ0868640.1 uroporphyrinogen-III synthase [Dasania phycosphaerae]